MASPGQKLQYILYVRLGDAHCEAVTALIPPRVRIAIQDVDKIPAERRPKWLNGVPLLARVSDRKIWVGAAAREQVRGYIAMLNTHVVLDPPKEEQLPMVGEGGEFVDASTAVLSTVPRAYSGSAPPSVPPPPNPSTPVYQPPVQQPPVQQLSVPSTPVYHPTPQQPSVPSTPQGSVHGQEHPPNTPVPSAAQPPRPRSNPNQLQPLPPPNVVDGRLVEAPVELPPMPRDEDAGPPAAPSAPTAVPRPMLQHSPQQPPVQSVNSSPPVPHAPPAQST